MEEFADLGGVREYRAEPVGPHRGDADDAADAWGRTLTFLADTLG